MDLERALEELGLLGQAEISAEALRRAYLRKVRQHSPERDPEGFKRVREAYELLQLHGQLMAARLTADPPPPAPSPPPPVAIAVPAPPVPDTAATTTSAQSQASADTRRELEALDIAAKPRRAAVLMVRLLEDVSTIGELPSPLVCADVALALLTLGEGERAGKLVAALEKRMAFEGVHSAPPVFAAQLKLIHELLTLRLFPETLVRCLAQGVRDGHMNRVAPVLRDVAGNNPHQLGELSVRAPSLFAAIRPYLPVERPRRERGWRWSWGMVPALWLAFQLLHLCTSSTRPAKYYAPSYSVAASAGETAARPVEAPPPPAPPPEPGSEERRAEGELADIERAIDAALGATDSCTVLNDQWSTYVITLRSMRRERVASSHYVSYQKRALEKCREFSVTFAENP